MRSPFETVYVCPSTPEALKECEFVVDKMQQSGFSVTCLVNDPADDRDGGAKQTSMPNLNIFDADKNIGSIHVARMLPEDVFGGLLIRNGKITIPDLKIYEVGTRDDGYVERVCWRPSLGIDRSPISRKQRKEDYYAITRQRRQALEKGEQ